MRKDSSDAMIEEINMLGPWVHGYFELGNGMVIRDSDEYQMNRLFALRNKLVDIISEHYGRDSLPDKTICDVGCNTGYFLFELFKRFQFKSAKGFDPHKTNVDKAKFIAKHFSLPKDRYSVSVDNLFHSKQEGFDIVIMPGVLHHLDDHITACKKLYKMTDDLLILESMILPDEVESPLVAEHLQLKDYCYKVSEPVFGVSGIKFESCYLDGTAATSGVVTIPSKGAIYLSLFNAGFTDIRLFDLSLPMDDLRKVQPKYRDFHMVIATAVKRKKDSNVFFEESARIAHQKEIDVYVPRHLIQDLYSVIQGEKSAQDLVGDASSVWSCHVEQHVGSPGSRCCGVSIDEPFHEILRNLSHEPADKIRFEFAKTLFFCGERDLARDVLLQLVRTLNCDWRTVYRSYHMLSLIALADNKIGEAIKLNAKALKTFPHFFPSKSLRESLVKGARSPQTK